MGLIYVARERASHLAYAPIVRDMFFGTSFVEVAQTVAAGPSTLRDRVALPASYTAILLIWSVPFIVVVVALVCFYASVLMFSVAGFLKEVEHPSNNNGPLFLSLVGMITGAYLLAIIVKAMTTVHVPQGIRMPSGTFPQLEKLIGDCTEQAGIEAPDDVFIVPEANAFAYSSGRFSLHERLNHYVLIGAPLLAMLEPLDLTAVLFHEFGHLILRRGMWAVSVHHKVEDFLTRCLRAQLHRQGCALVFTFIPGLMVALFLRAFRWSLGGFSKREELLVDGIAGRLMGEWQFRDRLVRSITTIAALSARLDNERPLVEQINAQFHRQLMAVTAPPAEHSEEAGYFHVARTVSMRGSLRWEDRLATVYDGLIRQRSGPTDSHPSLAERVQHLHGQLNADLPFYPSSPVHLFTIPSDAETTVSSGFASDLRAMFFSAKLAAGRGPLDGISPESVVEFRCRYGGCPRQGQIEISMTLQELGLLSADGEYRLPWHEIGEIAVYTGGDFNFFMTAARVLGAAFREAPSDRVLRLTLTNGGMIEFPHWHTLDNALEVEAIAKELWSVPRIYGTVTDERARPVRNASVRLNDNQGSVCSTTTTAEDGTYALVAPLEHGLAISVRAKGFVEAFSACSGGKRCRADLILQSAPSRDTSTALSAVQHLGSAATEVLRPPRRDGGGATGCLASLLKLGCAAVGYILPFVVAMIMTAPAQNFRGFGDSVGVCTVIAFCTSALGWRLGNRLAAKYLFTTHGRPRR